MQVICKYYTIYLRGSSIADLGNGGMLELIPRGYRGMPVCTYMSESELGQSLAHNGHRHTLPITILHPSIWVSLPRLSAPHLILMVYNVAGLL